MTEKISQNRKYNDLCGTCKNLTTCVYIRSGNRPILYCEEFEIQDSAPVHEIQMPPDTNDREELPVFAGLCKNCGNRFTCMIAKPDKIIWHCEEYV